MSAGIPEGSVEFVMEVLRPQSGPMKRRKILEELERRGHRISLAGLNRVLQVCAERHLTSDGPEGLRALPKPPTGAAADGGDGGGGAAAVRP